MRSVRRYQFFRRAYTDAALDQMRRLADLIIAGILLVITLPLMLFGGAGDQVGGARPDL